MDKQNEDAVLVIETLASCLAEYVDQFGGDDEDIKALGMALKYEKYFSPGVLEVMGSALQGSVRPARNNQVHREKKIVKVGATFEKYFDITKPLERQVRESGLSVDSVFGWFIECQEVVSIETIGEKPKFDGGKYSVRLIIALTLSRLKRTELNYSKEGQVAPIIVPLPWVIESVDL